MDDTCDVLLGGFSSIDGEVGVDGGGVDVLLRHGTCGAFVLLADGRFGASALVGVAANAPCEAKGVGGLDVESESEEGAELGEVEGEDAFDEDDGRGLDALRFGFAGVRGEVVAGPVDRAACDEFAKVGEEELGLEGVRVIEVRAVALLRSEVGEVAVVGVERKEPGMEAITKTAGQDGLAGARAAGDADDQRAARTEGRLCGWGHGCLRGLDAAE